jgi:hypothetical protein
VVEDEELGLVLAGPEEVFAQARAAADHLPELHVRLHRLREDQVHHLGHVDAGVEHVDRDGDGQLVVGVLEVVDELVGLRFLVVDDATEGRAVLRVELAEDLGEMHRVQVVPREDDGLADMLPVASRMPPSISERQMARVVSLLKKYLSRSSLS